jgi:serine/threonine-protein kinase
MSPEQANGTDLSGAADQYSLAVTAYELLTGQLPFPGDTVSEVVVALLTREPERPSTHRPDLGPRADAAILRGLHKSASKRWPSCRAFTDALLAALASRAITPVAPTVAAPAAAAPTAPPLASATPAPVDLDSSTLMTIALERDDLEQRPRWSWLTSLISSLAPTS